MFRNAHTLGTFGRALLSAMLLASVALSAGALQSQPVAANSPLVLAFYYTWFDENTWTPAKVPDFPVQTYASRDTGLMDRHIGQAHLPILI